MNNLEEERQMESVAEFYNQTQAADKAMETIVAYAMRGNKLAIRFVDAILEMRREASNTVLSQEEAEGLGLQG